MEGFYSISREHDETLRLLSGNDVKLYVYLVRRAAFRDTPLCKMGCLFDSLAGLAERAGLTVGEIRTSLKNLDFSRLITKTQHKRRHNICVTGYAEVDNGNTNLSKRLANDSQMISKKIARLEEVNKTINNITIAGGLDWGGEFEKLWKDYPKPRGKKMAYKHFRASVTTAADLAAIQAALKAYKAELAYNGTSLQFTLNGSTWFNDWQGHVPHKPTIQAPRAILKAPEPIVEASEEELREMHRETVKALGGCPNAECGLCETGVKA